MLYPPTVLVFVATAGGSEASVYDEQNRDSNITRVNVASVIRKGNKQVSVKIVQ